MEKYLYMDTFILTEPVLYVKIIQQWRHLKYVWKTRKKSEPF